MAAGLSPALSNRIIVDYNKQTWLCIALVKLEMSLKQRFSNALAHSPYIPVARIFHDRPPDRGHQLSISPDDAYWVAAVHDLGGLRT
jgi:hypothetical protein